MIPLSCHTRVYLALGATDMRKEINGHSVLVEGALAFDVFSGHLFVFYNHRRTTLKILFWDRNGFTLYQKRLEKDRVTVERERDKATAKLSNEQFLAKAPAEVVAKIRGRLEKAEADLARIAAQLGALDR